MSPQEVADLAVPAINVLGWITTQIWFPDDSQTSMRSGYEIVDELLGCLRLYHYVIMAAPSPANVVVYDVAIKPIKDAPGYVAFKVTFRIQP
jgi:hypothetical protein